MAERIPNNKKSKPFTTLSLLIYKKIPITGDKNYEEIWKKYFKNKKASRTFKEWLVEAYQKMGYENVEEYGDIFEEDEDFRYALDTAVRKMFSKINKEYFKNVSLKDNKQEFIKLKVEEEAEKEKKKNGKK